MDNIRIGTSRLILRRFEENDMEAIYLIFSDIARYTLDDAEVRIYFHLILSDGTEETIPMGVFEVSEANRHIKTLELKAYDYMLRFEKTLKLTASSGTAWFTMSQFFNKEEVRFTFKDGMEIKA